MGQTQSVSAVSETSGAAIKNENESSISRPQKQAMTTIIERRSDPSPEDAGSHNFGQPIRPPHHSSSTSTTTTTKSATITNDDKSGGASMLITDCRIQQRASLACIEENYHNKNEACVEYFAAYKQCRKEEHERKLEANARASAW